MIAPAETNRLTVLSLGAGQDSTYLLYRYIYDDQFRRQYAPGDFVVVMSDTGDEHEATYRHVKYLQKLANKNGIHFVFLTNDLGYHTDSWMTLITQYQRNKTCGMKAGGKKTCSYNLKVRPIYRWLSDYVGERYLKPEGVEIGRGKYGEYTNLVAFAGLYSKIDVMIGIARGEESRIEKAQDAVVGKWMRLAINRIYPLIDLGFDRADCQKGILGYGHPVPLPSNCRRCPFISEVELLWMYRFDRVGYDEWVEMEEAKIAFDPIRPRSKKNQEKLARGEIIPSNGVFGSRRLPEVLDRAQKKYGHMTDEELHEYKMSHGHCVKSGW